MNGVRGVGIDTFGKSSNGRPASQTLIVWSEDPETIWEPSLLMPTEQIVPLCAFCFSVLSSSVPADEGERA